MTALCRACGHEREAHRHYRKGTDCARCTCPAWRSPRRVLAALFGGAR